MKFILKNGAQYEAKSFYHADKDLEHEVVTPVSTLVLELTETPLVLVDSVKTEFTPENLSDVTILTTNAYSGKDSTTKYCFLNMDSYTLNISDHEECLTVKLV